MKGITMQDVQLDIPAIKIKNIVAEIRDITYEIIPDKIIIQGIIHKQIFYVGNDNIVHHQSDDMPFSTFIDVIGAEPGMLAQIEIEIEKIIAHLNPEGTVLVQKAILDIFVKIEEEEVVNVLLDPEGSLVELNQFIGENSEQLVIDNTVTLNQTALKVEEVRGEIRELGATIVDDEVLIVGTVHKQIFYVNQAETVIQQVENVDFDTSLSIPGATPDMNVSVQVDIELIDFELSLDGNTLEQEIVLNIFARITETIQARIADGFELLAKIPLVIGENTTQIDKDSEVQLEQPAQNLRSVIPEITELNAKVIEDKVLIQGVISKVISYIGTDSQEYQQTEEVRFSTFVEVPGAVPGQDVRVDAVIEDIIYQLAASNIVEQEVVIGIFAKVVELNQLYVTLDDSGPVVVLATVVAENNKQILVEQKRRIPPPQGVNIEFKTIVKRGEVIACQQDIVVDTVELDCPAIKVKEINATIEDVSAEMVTDNLALVTGIISKDIAYVCADNIVRHQNQIIPFAIEVPIGQAIGQVELSPEVQIENISFKLLNGGSLLRETIVLEACITTGDIRFVRVVTSITGPGITTDTVLVQEEVVISENPLITETQIFPVVTDVTDPQGLLTTIVKETLILNVVGTGEVPIEVVVFAE